MLVGSMGRAALLVAASFALSAHGYSPQPVGALSSDVDTREYCGRLGLPACVSEEGGNIIVHSCFSDGHPTVGAVDTNGTYMCVLCGEPNLYACECRWSRRGGSGRTTSRETRPPRGRKASWAASASYVRPRRAPTSLFRAATVVCAARAESASVRRPMHQIQARAGTGSSVPSVERCRPVSTVSLSMLVTDV